MKNNNLAKRSTPMSVLQVKRFSPPKIPHQHPPSGGPALSCADAFRCQTQLPLPASGPFRPFQQNNKGELYYFLGLQIGRIKTTKCVLSQFRRLEIQNQGLGSPDACGGEPSSPLLASAGQPAIFGDPGSPLPPVSASIFPWSGLGFHRAVPASEGQQSYGHPILICPHVN